MKKWIGILIIIGWLTGCNGEKTYEPVEINPEIDVCEICNMSIAHEHYATEVLLTNDEVYKFDDIGCMMEFLAVNELNKEEIAKTYVRDVDSGDWIELEDAFHSYHPDFWTPMANGVVTFKSREAAEEYEQGIGEIYDYEALLKHTWSWMP